MTGFRFVIRALLFVCALLLADCYVVSEVMIGGEGAAYIEPELAGLWRFPGKPGFMLIARHKNGEFSFHYFTGNFEIEAEYFQGRLTRIGGETFINARRFAALGGAATEQGYFPAYFRLEGNKLSIAIFEQKAFDAAIQSGKLKGVASSPSKNYASTPTKISGSGEEFGKFIMANYKTGNLWEKPQQLERIQVALPQEKGKE